MTLKAETWKFLEGINNKCRDQKHFNRNEEYL